jgi:hypothetical protein
MLKDIIFFYEFACFQLPLSGSRDYRTGPEQPAPLGLSTPSLGITVVTTKRWGAFFRGVKSLSTPSLGITEPDSGIFRLSAAFCRGTSSHK